MIVGNEISGISHMSFPTTKGSKEEPKTEVVDDYGTQHLRLLVVMACGTFVVYMKTTKVLSVCIFVVHTKTTKVLDAYTFVVYEETTKVHTMCITQTTVLQL